jgi:hypothetical protein
MIGLHGKSGKICDHVNSLIETKNTLSGDIDNIKNNICASNDEIAKAKSDLESIRADIELLKIVSKNSINHDEIDELISDIRNSFEIYINQTPRTCDDNRFLTLEKRLSEIDNKFNELIGDVEIIKPTTRSIPKINLQPRKNKQT